MEIWLAGPILPDRLRACEREPARGGSKRMGRRRRRGGEGEERGGGSWDLLNAK